MFSWYYIIILCSAFLGAWSLHAQDTDNNEALEENIFEGPLYEQMSEADVAALMVAFERRILIPPLMGEKGVNVSFGFNFKSVPLIADSPFVEGLASSISLIPMPTVGLEWASERQRVFLHLFYLPYFPIATSPLNFGTMWAAFGQDLLLAPAGKPGRGLIFSYRFSYSAVEMTRQFTMEDSENLARWSSHSLTSEMTLGWRFSGTDLTYWVGTGNVTNLATENDSRHNSQHSLMGNNAYGSLGGAMCFRDERICTSVELHLDALQNFVYAGSFVIRK